MVRIKPFAAIRPPKELVEEVASRPYDVLNSAEAKAEASEKSLLHITRPEIDFEPMVDEHSEEAYGKAVENFRNWQKKGWLVQDNKPCYYIYAQTMNGKTQYGLVLCAHTDDYSEGRIKKHELTRKDNISSKDVYEAAKEGDKLALKIFEFTGKMLGQSFADFVAFSAPEAIVLFGGLARAKEFLYTPIVDSMNANLLPLWKDKIKIVFSQLKESDAAILGASALAWEL